MRQLHFEVNDAEYQMAQELKNKLHKSISDILRELLKTKYKKEILTVSKILCIIALCIAAASCGGQAGRPMPIDTPMPRPTPTPTISAASVLNMGMIGQTWTFQNSLGSISTFDIEAVPDNTGCRSGNNLAIHMTKTTPNTYWQFGADQAEIWFVLHQNDDNSWRSTASLINMPLGSPFSGPLIFSSDVIDNQPGMPAPYMIAPPNTASGQHFTYETRSSATASVGLSYVCNIPSGQALTGTTDGEYWRTDFYFGAATTPAYSGPVVISEQFEGICGHELWYFAPGLGIVEIDSPNDGGEIKNNPVCVNYSQHAFSGSTYNIKRIS